MAANSESPLDPEELGGLIAELVHDHVERALPVVVSRVQGGIVIPEAPAGKDGAPGPQGDPGVVDPELVQSIVARSVETQIEAIRPSLKGEPGEPGSAGAPGRDGVDGKDAEPEVVRMMAAEAVSEFVEGFGKALAARFEAAAE